MIYFVEVIVCFLVIADLGTGDFDFILEVAIAFVVFFNSLPLLL